MKNLARISAGFACLTFAAAPPALAQDTSAPAPAAAAPAETATAPPSAKFDKFDALKPQGQSADLPGTYNSVLQDTGGFRSWLYDNDMYFRGQSATSITRDVAGGRNLGGTQAFNGQKTTVTNTEEARISKKIDGSGGDIGQINFSLAYTRVNWDQVGPNSLSVYRLDYYQSLFHKKVELDVGIGSNIVNFIGIFSGGNLLLANGLAATIPLEVGLSGGSATTPLANIQINGPGGLYSKSGIQRSTSPQGAIYDIRHSDHGLDLTMEGSRALYIQEFGLMKQASADTHQIWLRGGAIINPTRYNRIDGKGTEKNWAIYALADYQLIQSDKTQPYRGLYVGGSVLIAPDAVNVFKQTYEARAYAMGVIPGRPGDSINFTVDYNRFSSSGGDALALQGQVTHRYQFSAGLLYSIGVTHGVFLQPSATYVRNPSFTGTYKPAINLATSLTFVL